MEGPRPEGTWSKPQAVGSGVALLLVGVAIAAVLFSLAIATTAAWYYALGSILLGAVLGGGLSYFGAALILEQFGYNLPLPPRGKKIH